MKKIILLLCALFLSFSAYSQFPNPGIEGFEGTTGPEALPSNVWNLATGVPGNQWAVFSNGVGGGRWTISPAGNAYQGVNAAYMNRVQTVTFPATSENYLATPKITVPANGQLRFWTRTFTLGNNGTLYDVKVAPGTSSQTTIASYTTNLITYTEDELTLSPQGVQNAYNVYTEKIINFPVAMHGQQVYVAFVRRNEQSDGSLDGDRWLIDSVQLNERCQDPTGPTTAGVFSTSANLTWANPSGATSWEIEVLPTASTPTGFGVIYNGALPYQATTTSSGSPLVQTPLTPTTTYKYYVRAICPGNIPSEWVGPTNFATTLTPPACNGTYTDPGGPTANYPNNIAGTNGTTVICPNVSGQQVTVTFTSFATQATNDTLLVYDGPAVTPGALLGTYSGTLVGANLPGPFTSSAASGCLTFVFTSNGSVAGAGWVANVACLPPPPCPKPTAVVTVPFTSPAGPAVTPTSINFGWTNVGPATAWEYVILPCTAAAPTAATVGTPAPTNPLNVTTGIASNSCYNIYVRGNCSSTGNGMSVWSSPLTVNTPIAPPVCNGNFVDTGGVSGDYPANANSTVQICGNNPGDIVTVTFTALDLENGFDFLAVYDGMVATPSALIATLTGGTTPGPFTGTTASGCLTFVFTSDANGQESGWLANVTCTTPPPCQKPTALTFNTLTNNSVTFGWTNVGAATTWEVIALPCTAPPPTATTVGITVLTNSYTFPNNLLPVTCYSLYVRGNCTSTSNGMSLWSGPLSVTTQVAPPICGGNYVDSGGPTGNYANNTNSTVIICPLVAGDQVTVTFSSFFTEAQLDGVYVYNGMVATPTALVSSGNGPGLATGPLTAPGAFWGNLTGNNIPGPFTSAAPDGCLTFVFLTNGSGVNPGFMSTVSCAPPPTCAKPTNLTATVTGPSSATLTWVQPPNIGGGTATTWRVIVQLAGAGAPLPGALGATVFSTTYPVNGLIPNTAYEYYVQAICSPTDSSPWGGPRGFFMASTCTSSQPFCGDTGLAYVNTTGQPNLGNIGCLLTSPNPAWYFMQVNQTGNLNFQISQTNGAGGGLDVDFICWGPFTPAQYSSICTGLFDFPDGNTGIPSNVIACSYSAAPIENFIIPNAVSGNFYMVLITNFSNQAGSVTFNQTGGTGNTNCNLVCSVALGTDVVLCNAASYTITATTQGATGYTWYFNNSATPIPGQTTSSLVVTQTGDYRCVIACGLNTAQDTVHVTFNTPVAATFTFPTTVCQGLAGPTLPGSSSNPIPITGSWSPTTVNTLTVGTTPYTFTPTVGQCASVQIVNITVSSASVVTTFGPFPSICQDLPAPALPAASTNSTPITGSWNPTTINTSAVGTLPYVFTPGIGQCATQYTLFVTIDAPSIAPLFTGLATTICQGLPAPVLPTSSNNPTPITGTWSPATIDTAVLGSSQYIFTPAGAQCALPYTLNFTVTSPSIQPTFNTIPTLCQGDTPPALPTLSTNSTQISGTWSPLTISTTTPGTTPYIFTPDPGQCAVDRTINVTVVAPTTPVFTQVPPICQGGTAPALPTSATVTGSWTPATISTTTPGITPYIFTPNGGQCASPYTMQITIIANPVVAAVTNVNSCDSYTLPALAVGNYFTSQNGVGPITSLTLTTSQLVYVYAQSGTTPNCTDQKSFQVTITDSPEFNIEGGCNGTSYVLHVANPNFNLDTATYNWSGPSVVNNGNPTLVVTVSGIYTCTVTVSNGTSGCSTPHIFDATASAINCQIAQGISPNGDGLNDTFDLSGFNVSRLAIFNRYGKTVYSRTDYKNEWGGQSDSGNELPDGTYYYIIERKDGGDTRTGWIYINREIR